MSEDATLEQARSVLNDAEFAELQAGLQAMASKRVFYPTPKQLEVVNSEADVIGYGGAAGGGKSYLITGLAASEHVRSAIVRPQKNQTRKFVQELTKMLGTRDGYASQTSSWQVQTPDGVDRHISFFGLDNPGDEEKQQGEDFDLKCVGAGTLVWMADGSRKPVEEVQIGDEVTTLEGPRRVLRTIRQHKAAVLLKTEQGSQVQGASHRLLGPHGWRSAEDVEDRSLPKVRGSSFATPTLDARKCAGSLSPTSSTLEPLRDNPPVDQQRATVCAQDREDRRSASGFGAEMVRTGERTADAGCCDQHQAGAPRPSPSHVLQAQSSALPHRSAREGDHQALRSDVLGAPPPSSLPSYPARCSSAHYPCDGPPHLCAEGDQPGRRQQGDVGLRNPIYLLEDADPRTRRHSHHVWSWPHPYTRETRTTDHQLRAVASEHFDVGSVPLFDLTVDGANHYITQQGFINQNCYDEATQMRESDVRYTLTWNRTDIKGQRVRAVLAFNPPTTPEGRWVIKFFRPWLDKQHPNPAKDGELRWFATVGDEQDYELAGPQPFIIKYANGQPKPWYSFNPADHRPEDIIRPKSRTFIHALVTDNPYYMATDYISQLQSLPEPLRSQMLKGDFAAGVTDAERQVIPTKWIDAAMARWEERAALYRSGAAKKGPLDSLGVDVARGGNMGSTQGATGHDEMVISPRYGTFFDELIAHKGIAIDDGSKAAALVIGELKDSAPVHVDVIGVGTSVVDFLTVNNVHTIPVNGAAGPLGVASGHVPLRFANRRAELHWRMREALDPSNPEPIALPPDPMLATDLAAPSYFLGRSGIQIEAKDDIKKKIGRSPDRGDAVINALIMTPKRGLVVTGYIGHNLPTESWEQRRLRELES